MNSFSSSFDNDDILEIVRSTPRTKKPTLVSRMAIPKQLSSRITNAGTVVNTESRRGRRESEPPGRKESRSRSRSQSIIRNIRKRAFGEGKKQPSKRKEDEVVDDTNSLSDSENSRKFLSNSGSLTAASTIKQMKKEDDVYRRRPNRDGHSGHSGQNYSGHSGQKYSRRSSSKSKPMPLEAKGLFDGRSRSKDRSKVDPEASSSGETPTLRRRKQSRGRDGKKEEKRSRERSKSRLRSKSRARSKSKTRTKSRARSKSAKGLKNHSKSSAHSSEQSETSSKRKSSRRGSSKAARRSSSKNTTASPKPSKGAVQPFIASSPTPFGSVSLESDTIDSMASQPKSPRPRNILDSPQLSRASKTSKASSTNPSNLRLPPLHREVVRTNSSNSDGNREVPKMVPRAMNKRRSLDSLAPAVVTPLAKHLANKDPEPSGKEWNTDLTKTTTDDSTHTFDRLWAKDSSRTPDATKKQDEDDGPSQGTKRLMEIAETTRIAPVKGSFVKGLENSLHNKFSKYDEQLYESEAKLKDLEGQVADLEDQLDAKDLDLREVQQQLKDSFQDSERQRLLSEEALVEMKDQISEMQEALERRESQVETLQRQLDIAYKENNQEMYDAEVKLKDLKEKIASLQESLDQKDNEVDDLKRRLDDADHKYEDKMGEERDEANIHLKDFREQVAALQDTLDEKETQVIKMQGQITEAETENKILLEELEQLMLEKSEAEAEAKAATSGDGNANDKIRIKELEKDLEDASNVAKLQLDELDEQVDGLRDKLSAERMDAAANLKARDATIDELTIKLRKYEAVPSSTMSSFTFHPSIHTAKYSTTKHSTNDPSCADSVVSDKTGTGSFAAGSFASPSFGMGEIAPETPEINTDDVTDIEGAKQKVYEARADATSVRESLEISTKRCAELTLDNERLTKRNSELVDTTRERDELKDKVRDWTAEAYRWKRRAEDAESKLAKLSNPETSDAESDPIAAQENMIKAAMNNNSGRAAPKKEEKSGGWSFFGMSAASNPNSAHDSATFRSDGSEGDSSSAGKDAQIENLNETIAKLRSEMFQVKTSHKEEKYLTEKRIAQLEGENEALTLQNGTLEQLSRFHEDQ